MKNGHRFMAEKNGKHGKDGRSRIKMVQRENQKKIYPE
jgi:hypothetical protein